MTTAPNPSTHPSAASHAPNVAQAMAHAAAGFLDSLTATQREAAAFPFDGDERYEWHFTPVPHLGLQLADMTDAQRQALQALIGAGLSVRGAEQAESIVRHEALLNEWEQLQRVATHWRRDPKIYYASVFGDPGGRDPWGWRFNGHHLALHFTIVDRVFVAPLPLFFGINPAEVRHGPHAGLRVLGEEEDLARALLGELTADQRRTAVVDTEAPRDIITANYRVADPDAPPRGLAFEAMSGDQRERLVALIRHYVDRATGDLAHNEWSKVEAAGLAAVTFAWAGSDAPGQGHYYALKGPTFLIEYDNTQNDANHIHSVWRDFTNDFGEDLLAAHYAASGHHPG